MSADSAKEYVCPWTGQTISFKEIGSGRWHAVCRGFWMSKPYKTIASVKRAFGRRHPLWTSGDNRSVCPFTGADLEETFEEGMNRWTASSTTWRTTRSFDKEHMYQFLAAVDGKFPDLPDVKVVDNTAPMVDIIREEAEERNKAVNDAIEEASDKGLLPDAIVE